jgi:hypothetical protein
MFLYQLSPPRKPFRLSYICVEIEICFSQPLKTLHYICETEAPQSTAKALQYLIVLKEIASDCRRWGHDIKKSVSSRDLPEHQRKPR